MTVRTPPRPDPPMAKRLFAAGGPSLREHLGRFGQAPAPTAEALIAALGAAGLTGRGGAGFPTARKIASITGPSPVVVGNAAEGEPLSSKDATLMSRSPHLVLDGLQIVARALGADKAYLYLPASTAPATKHALTERAELGRDTRRVTIVEAPDTFVAGEESAVVRRIEGGPPLPRDRKVPTSTSGVRGRPTLVSNVETLAHVALIARYGHRWFRSVGDAEEPGTMLITVSGATTRRCVLDLPTGTPLIQVLARGGVHDVRSVRAVLVGGYHGGWIPTGALAGTRLSRSGLAGFGASPGAGIVHALSIHECGLARTSDIVAYLAEQSAGQCGPCRLGLPRLARQFDDLAYGRVTDGLLDELHQTLGLVENRGACRHPDGVVRLARSAIQTFAGDVAHHRASQCDIALVAARAAERGEYQSSAGNA